MLAQLTRWARRISQTAAMTGGVLILLSALVVFVDVIARKLVGWTVGGADELSGYALAISTVWALPYCLLWRANIRVDSLYRLTPPSVRSVPPKSRSKTWTSRRRRSSPSAADG